MRAANYRILFTFVNAPDAPGRLSVRLRAAVRRIATLLRLIDRTAFHLENRHIGPGAWAATFATIVLARHLLEILAGQNPVYFPSQFYLHYPLAYVAPLLALVLVLHLGSRVPVIRITRLMLYAWALTLLPPLVDLATGKPGEAIGYLRLEHRSVGEVFLRFFDPRVSFGGTTAGIRVEALLACLLGALYVVLRRPGSVSRRALATAATALGVYITALGFFTLPYLADALLAPWLPLGGGSSLFTPPTIIAIPPPLDVRVADHVALIYLVPLCLILAGAWLARVDSRRLWGLLTATLQPLLLWPPLLAAAGVATGAAVRAHLAAGLPAPAPVDLLAAGALPVAALLAALGGRLVAGTHGDAAAGLVLAAGGLCLAVAAGPEAAVLLSVAISLSWLAAAAHLGKARFLLAPACHALAGLACLGSGAAWALGVDALAALAPGLVLGILVATSSAALAVEAGATATVAGRWRLAAVLAAGALAVVAVPLSSSRWLAAVMALGAWLAAMVPRLAGRPARRMESLAMVAATGLGLAAVLLHVPSREALAAAGVDRPKFAIRQGMAAEAAGEPEAAIRRYRRALSLEPDQPRVLARLGELLQRGGDTEAARAALAAAVALDGDDVAALQQLGILLLQAGEPEEAVEHLARAAALAPADAVVAASHAEALSRLPQRRAEATSAWRRYLKVSVGDPAEEAQRVHARSRLRQLDALEVESQ